MGHHQKRLRAPFPWFGGKSKIADLVWSRFGNVRSYVEPFAGSLAVLLGRPSDHFQGAIRLETVNDLDSMIANFWRATSSDPEAVSSWSFEPVHEVSLHARHGWLRDQLATDFSARLMADPDFFDAKIAGWWAWGISCWFGLGWCDGSNQRFSIPSLSTTGRGVNGEDIRESRDASIRFFVNLRARLDRVRVTCGDWSRVVTPAVLQYDYGTCGVLLDPPYLQDGRTNVYRHESPIAREVVAWCHENGDKASLRIALCGYEGDYEMPSSWECVPWKAHGGFSHTAKNGENENSARERIWFSPGCVSLSKHGRLF